MDKFLVCVGIVGNYPSSEVIEVETLFVEALKKNKNENDIKKYMKERLTTILTTGFLMRLDKISKFYFLNIYVENKNNIII